MTDIFDAFPTQEGRPVRRKAGLRLKVDADGNPVLEPTDVDSVSLSEDGCIDQVTVTPDRFLGCGCSAQSPIGNRCNEPECGRVSCQDCARRCESCGKPLCLEHSRKLEQAERTLTLCGSCHGRLRRRRSWAAVVRVLSSPFFEHSPEKKS